MELRWRRALVVLAVGGAVVLAAVASAPTVADAEPAPDEPVAVTPAGTTTVCPAADPCTAMRDTGEWSEDADSTWPHLADRALERAVRRYYARQVYRRGLDDRRLGRHPLVMARGVTAGGAAVAACVAQWEHQDPRGALPGTTGRFAARHRFAEITFEFNDAGDGESAYTAFVDVKTYEVAAAFHYNNFQP